MPVPMARKRRERAYAGLQRIHKKVLITIKQINKFFILIKDYTNDMSKDYRRTVEKAEVNR
jgi:hypothetical protein